MSTLLEHAFEEARKRPAGEQDAIADLVLDALSEQAANGSPVVSRRFIDDIREGVAQGRADVVAGRLLDGKDFCTELRREFGQE